MPLHTNKDINLAEDINLILASQSPRRLELLQKEGFEPVVVPSCTSEEVHLNLSPNEFVMYLSFKKAYSLLEDGTLDEFIKQNARGEKIKKEKPTFILAADTVVYSEKVLGKPINRQEAFDMISSYSGKTHSVFTGVTLLYSPTGDFSCDCTKVARGLESKVSCREITSAEIDAYLNLGDYKDKAGAYGIQGEFKKFVTKIEGSFDSIVGLPAKEVVRMAADLVREPL